MVKRPDVPVVDPKTKEARRAVRGILKPEPPEEDSGDGEAA